MRSITGMLRRLLRPPVEAEQADVQRCEALRARLLASDEVVGDVFEAEGGGKRVTVREETAIASSSPEQGLFLYRLVRLVRPTKVVEFGSATGVSGSYIVSALARNGSGRLVTIEGSPSRQRVASASIESVVPGYCDSVAGFFDDHLEALDGADLFFLDGNHWAEPTLRYVDAAFETMRAPATIVLDDIRGYSEEMNSVWGTISRDMRFSYAGEAGGSGIVVRDEPEWLPSAASHFLWETLYRGRDAASSLKRLGR